MQRIGLTMRTLDRHGERHEAISRGWLDLLSRRAAQPVLLPSAVADPVAEAERARIDMLVLTGGNDVQGAAAVGSDSIDNTRDAAESALLRWGMARRVPVLAVCRGLQLLDLELGGRVSVDAAGRAHVATRHEIRVDPAWGEPLATTNSFHQHAIRADGLAKGLRSIATSADGLVEAAIHEDLPIVGVMWHPEREGSCAALDARIWTHLERQL